MEAIIAEIVTLMYNPILTLKYRVIQNDSSDLKLA
jgi:hypothetical protein